MQVMKNISITLLSLSFPVPCEKACEKQGCSFIEPHHAANPKGEFIKVLAGPLQTFLEKAAEHSSLLVIES